MSQQRAIRATYHLLAHAAPVEIRVIQPATSDRGSQVLANFMVENEAEFVRTCQQWDGKGNVYVGSRERRLGFAPANNQSAKKRDITVITVIPVDIDARRPKGLEKQAATDVELQYTLNAAEYLRTHFFSPRGFVPPVRAMSGNGVQLWLCIPRYELPQSGWYALGKSEYHRIEDAIKFFFHEIQQALPQELQDKVSVDAIHDLTRIIKVIGTMSVKGDPTKYPDRPHRRSYFIDEPVRVEDAEFLNYLLEIQPDPHEKTQKNTSQGKNIGSSSETPELPKAFEELLQTNLDIGHLWNTPPADGDCSDHDWHLGKACIEAGITDSVKLREILSRAPYGKFQRDRREDYLDRTVGKLLENPQRTSEESQTETEPGAAKPHFKSVVNQIGATFTIDSDSERVQAIEQIIESLLDLSPTEQATLIGKMRDAKLGTKAELERQLREAAKSRQEAEKAKTKAAKTEAEASDDNRSSMGLFEGKTCYYRYVEVGKGNYQEKPLSSFLIKPKLRVWLDGKENLTVDFVTAEQDYPDVIIRRRDWNGKDRFMDAFPSVDLQWHGSQNDVQNVLAIVASYDVPTKQGTTQLGRQANGLWILPDGTAFDKNGLVTDPELVYLPVGGQGELDDKIYIPELDEKAYTALLENVYSNLLAVNVPEVMIPTIGWFMATPFKPQMSLKYEGFPLLSLAGTRGAGKSTLLRLMWRLMGFKVGDDGKLFSCTETDFVMLKLLSATTSIPILFDEYKPYDMPPMRLKALTRLLRKAYDGEKELRGRPDQTTVEYGLTAPLAIAGEVALSEGALLERIIAVDMSPNDLNDVMRKAYQTLRSLSLQTFMSRYIPFCLSTDFDKELNKAEVLAADLLDIEALPDRIRKNLTVMIFGFSQFVRFGVEQGILDESADLTDALKEAVNAVKTALCGEEGVTKVALDYMVEHLATMAETGRLRYGRDYVIRESYEDIAIRFDSCFAEFRKYHRETQLDGELLNDKAYRKQIKENYELKGNNKQGWYIAGMNVSVKYRGKNKKSIILDPIQAEALNLDLSGFFGNEEVDVR